MCGQLASLLVERPNSRPVLIPKGDVFVEEQTSGQIKMLLLI